MNVAPGHLEVTLSRASSVPPPDWDNVPFEVSCARCGHDIRGLTEPKCPACGLEFDWAEAVPIEQITCQHCGYHLYGLRETRCPECGRGFTWEEVLTIYHRKRIPLFEYHWRKRPIRLLIGTWFRAALPRKLWRMVDIHDPPQVRPLLAMAAISSLVPVLSAAVFIAWMDLWVFRGVPPWPPAVDKMLALIWIILEQFSSPALSGIFVPEALWCAASFASLMLFRQSMKRYKVRVVHVFRVWIYAVVFSLPLVAIAFAFVALFLAVRVLSPNSMMGLCPMMINTLIWAIPLTLVACAIWRLGQGYRYYLRMDHSLGIAFASQIIACLCVLLISSVYAVLSPGCAVSEKSRRFLS